MNIKELFEKKRRAEEQARSLIQEHKGKETYTSEIADQVDKWLKEATEMRKQIEQVQELEKMEAEEARRELEKEKKETKSNDTEKELRNIWTDYILGRISEREAREKRAAATQTTTTTAGGYTIPEGWMSQIVEALKAYGGVYPNANVFRTPTGNDMKLPTIDDTSNVAYLVAESTDPSDSANNAAFTFGQASFSSFKYTSGLILVPMELLQDAEITPVLETFMVNNLRQRMSRGMNAIWTTGAGTTTCEGVVTGATASSTTPAASALTRDNILALLHDVDPLYRSSGKFMFNDSTLEAIKKLTFGDSDNRPLWQPSVAAGAPDTIEGKPYIINQSMADIGASASSVLFGDFSYYYIREVADWRLVRMNERYAEKDQVGFTLFARYDAKVIDAGTNPIKKLTHAAS